MQVKFSLVRIGMVNLCLVGIMAFTGCQSSQQAQKDAGLLEKADTMHTTMDSVSYILGTNVHENFNRGGFGINDTMVLKGLRDAIASSDTLISEDRKKQIIRDFQKKMQKKQQQEQGQQGRQKQRGRQQERQQMAKENKEKSQAFLKKNKQKDGVKTTESGLQYKVLEKGDGPSPSAQDTVKVHYKGELRNGEEFDNSYKRGKPAEFPVNGVISGWQEGLQLMKEGAKYKLFVPPELGYGARGAGRKIGPNEVLIFEVELMEVK